MTTPTTMTITTRAHGPHADADQWAITANDGHGHLVTLFSPAPTAACHRSTADTLAREFGLRVTGRARRGAAQAYIFRAAADGE